MLVLYNVAETANVLGFKAKSDWVSYYTKPICLHFPKLIAFLT